MRHYTAITIIYNPHSTGPGKKLAGQLKAQLQNHYKPRTITLVATKHAAHAEEIAYHRALASKRPLIVSASGDGGYHEVVNGVLRAQAQGASPTTALIPAGNANDHYKALHRGDLARNILHKKTQRIDVLRLEYTENGKTQIHYAHSYIGLGLTPQAGKELNSHSRKRLLEGWLVLKTIARVRAVRLIVHGRVRTYDSLIFSNIGKMSKVLMLSHIAKANDGKFEVTTFRRRHKLRLFGTLLRATTRGLKGTRQATRFTFATIHPTLLQLDGEIITIHKNTEVTVTVARRVLTCIV